MLVLSRKVGEQVRIGESIDVMVLTTANGRVRLGIHAPSTVPIRRAELDCRPIMTADGNDDRLSTD